MIGWGKITAHDRVLTLIKNSKVSDTGEIEFSQDELKALVDYELTALKNGE